jgi:beta-lactamase superfamily II metal-dependent hydrolase
MQAASSDHLDIYFIDVGGGQATLIVTPKGESLLIDAGWPGMGGPAARLGDAPNPRDPERILAAMRNAGVTKIDILVATHFHRDHIGGIPELAQRVPIKTFIDYGSAYPPQDRTKTDVVDAQDVQAYDDYLPVRAKAAHLQPRPGDTLPIKGIRATVVTTNGIALRQPLRKGGRSNPACPPVPRFTSYAGDENLRSVGVVIEYGRFRFLDLGDLNGPPLFDLVCPKDLIGRIDLYLAPHHGGSGTAEPATLAAFQPRAVVVNNGPRKGGRADMLKMLSEAKTLDAWQLHLSVEGADHNSPPQRTANIDPETAYGLTVRAKADGSFILINGRTGLETRYPSHK